MSGSGPQDPPQARFEFVSKITTGYMAFVAALSLAILALGKDCYPWTRIFPLLVLSLPSLVAALFLQQRRLWRNDSGAELFLALAYVFGLSPSLYATVLLVSHFWAVGGVIFAVLCPLWLVALYRVMHSSAIGTPIERGDQ